MNHTDRKKTRARFQAGVVILSLMLCQLAFADETESTSPLTTEEMASSQTSTFQNYSGLADLVSMICDDTLERFQSFYKKTLVTVEPFTTIGFYEKNKQSELGLTLADQMRAVINNDTMDNHPLSSGKRTQKLTGVLQEVDGYLRIHISGVNAAGERTSYVVSVEMSEPIYRALHTYL